MTEELQTVHMSDGCALKVKVFGNESTKPLMLCHHGSPGLVTHAETAAQFKVFADCFRVLVFDSRGSGASDKKRPYSHPRFVQDMDELRQWAGAEQCLIVGTSHGGMLALEYALAYPSRIFGVITADAAAQWSHWAAMNAIKTALTDPRVGDIDPDQLVRVLSGTTTSQEDMTSLFPKIQPLYAVPDHLKGQSETDLDEVLAEALDLDHETSNGVQGDAMSRFDVRDRLHEIQVPVFVCCGRYDWICPVAMSEEISRSIPNSKLVVYEKSGHWPALEEKTKFQEDARDFFRTLELKK